MKPLNYAVLKYFTTVEEACVTDVMKALESDYGNFSAFTKPSILNALMVSNANAILEESHFDLDDNEELRIYFRITETGSSMIKTYIKD